VKKAALELSVSESAISGHVAQLRKELSDQLFGRAQSGIAFTPGGLRLATRANEMLGLQNQTIREVGEAGRGRRVLRLAVSSLFAEYAAPGLIEMFSARSNDLEVEMRVQPAAQFQSLLAGRVADMAIGPSPRSRIDPIALMPFLKYQIVVVAGPQHPLAGRRTRPGQLQKETWMLGPSAAEIGGVTGAMLRALKVPESAQRIFQSHAAALEEIRRGNGVGLAVSFAAAEDIGAGRLVEVSGPATRAGGIWTAMTLSESNVASSAAELGRFITTPRAIQAMLHGSGANIGHFKPAVHITLWS